MRAALAWSQFELCRAIEEGPRYLHGGPLMRLLSAWDAFSKLYTSFALEARAAERDTKVAPLTENSSNVAPCGGCSG